METNCTRDICFKVNKSDDDLVLILIQKEMHVLSDTAKGSKTEYIKIVSIYQILS
jgi:hypothetical protein